MKKITSFLLVALLAFTFIIQTPTAQAKSTKVALLGIGSGDYVPIDVKVNQPERDLESEVQDAKESVVKKMTKDASDYLLKQLSKIEKDILTSSFLYYGDALTANYAEEYLTKYVKDPKEQQVIRYMIPQFACSPQANSTTQQQRKNVLLKTKAQDYLGFDPSQLDTSDPQFYQKMARMGDVYSNPLGWQLQYEAIAAAATQSAETASQNEVTTSAGLKIPRNDTGDMVVTANRLIQFQSAALSSQLQSGFQNAEFDAQIKDIIAAAKSGGSLLGNVFSGNWGAVGSQVGGAVGGALEDKLNNEINRIASGVLSALTNSIYNQLTNATFIKGSKVIQEKKTCIDDSVQVSTVAAAENGWGGTPIYTTPTPTPTSGPTPTPPADQSLQMVISSIPVSAAPGDPVTISWNLSAVQGFSYLQKDWSSEVSSSVTGSDTVTAPATQTSYGITAYDAFGNILGHTSTILFIDAGPRG